MLMTHPPARLDRWLDAAPRAAERRPMLALALLCLLLWLPGFFTLPPTDRDEARFAQATKQMLETDDYVRIRFHTEERNKKPVGIHWAQATTLKVVEALHIGDRTQIWPYRVPSLLGCLLAVLATFQFGRAIIGKRPALLAAAMLAGSMVVMAEAHIAKTDAALLASVTAAMGILAQAYLRPGAFTAKQAAAFWLCMGVSILLKGPIGPLIALLSGITLAVVDKGAPWLRALRPAWGVPLMLGVALPWLVAIGIATEGRFFSQAVGGDMLGKVGAGEEKHWGPPGFYILTFAITAFPAAWAVLAALPGAWKDRHSAPTRFLLAWIVPSWLLFEAVQTKLPHYTMPMFPALMLLGAAWAMDPLRAAPPRWAWLLGRGLLLAVTAGIAVFALAAPWFLHRSIHWGGPLAAAAAVALAVVVWRQWRRGDMPGAVLASVVLAAPLYFGVMEGMAPHLRPIWVSDRLAAELRRAAPGLPAERFGITSYSEPSMIFRVGTATTLLRTGEDSARWLQAAPGRVVAVGDRAEAAFRREVAARGMQVREIGSVTGLNYSRGRFLTLQLFRLGD